ncbi:hypothetical protein AB0E10_09265 [Streptomyces sp. NPDC048045]|uniref:hypothetical protein n=1 Tax=Streptomyces sp. NPDC048045 TaxID=3154710 RepID=UPI0034499DCB
MITLSASETFTLTAGLLTLTPGRGTAVARSRALIACAHVIRDRRKRPSARRLDRVTGTAKAAFGIRLTLGQ